MKNLIKVTLIVAGLSLSGIIVKAQQKFAHINSQELLESMPEMKAADASLVTYQKSLQAQLESMASEREKKFNAYQEKGKGRSEANKDVVDKELQTMVAELQDLEKRINDADQKAQQDYKTKSDELFGPIITKATNAVNSVAKEKGYAYVFDVSQPTVIYFGGGDNILAAVQAKLGITAPAVKPLVPAVKVPPAK